MVLALVLLGLSTQSFANTDYTDTDLGTFVAFDRTYTTAFNSSMWDSGSCTLKFRYASEGNAYLSSISSNRTILLSGIRFDLYSVDGGFDLVLTGPSFKCDWDTAAPLISQFIEKEFPGHSFHEVYFRNEKEAVHSAPGLVEKRLPGAVRFVHRKYATDLHGCEEAKNWKYDSGSFFCMYQLPVDRPQVALPADGSYTIETPVNIDGVGAFKTFAGSNQDGLFTLTVKAYQEDFKSSLARIESDLSQKPEVILTLLSGASDSGEKVMGEAHAIARAYTPTLERCAATWDPTKSRCVVKVANDYASPWDREVHSSDDFDFETDVDGYVFRESFPSGQTWQQAEPQVSDLLKWFNQDNLHPATMMVMLVPVR